MKIRNEVVSDIKAIEELTLMAFENHPHHAPGVAPNEHVIINKLRASGALTLSLVAEDDNKIIGHISYSPIKIDGAECNWLCLAPISVMPNRQSKGIGSALIKTSLAELQTRGIDGVALIGEPLYYGRFGFKPNEKLTCQGIPSEYFMVLDLSKNAKSIPIGNVTFHEAFD